MQIDLMLEYMVSYELDLKNKLKRQEEFMRTFLLA